MKKLITLLLSVCMLVTLTPALSFAYESDGQQDTEQVLQTGSQDDALLQSNDQSGKEDVSEPASENKDELSDEPVSDVIDPPSNEPAAEVIDAPKDETVTEDIEASEDEDVKTVLSTKDYQDGWVPNGDKWQYKVNGEPVTSWYKVGNYWYHFDGGGNMQNGIQSIGSNRYYLNSAGSNPATDYFGAMQTGLKTIQGKTYFFNPNGSNPKNDGIGSMQVDVVNVPGVGYCYFDTSDTNYGVKKTGLINARRGKCYFDPSKKGVMTTGKKTIGSSTYFFNTSNGVMVTNSWQTSNGKKYYFGPKGKMKTGWLTLGNNKYYLGDNGAMRTGWKTINGDKYYFNTSNGVMYKGGPKKIGNYKYYFKTSNGKMVKGWQTISGKKYFFNTTNGRMRTGWLTYGGKKYYLKSSGAARIGLATINGNRYYFQSDASMMRNRAVKVKGKLYYFFYNGKGYKKKGWFTGSDGGKRYSLGKGRVQTGKKKINGVWYKFNKYTGIAKALGDAFDNSIQSQTSQTQYLIAINRAKYEVRVYQGGKNNWTRIKKMSCGVGAPATPTPKGNFVTTMRMQVNTYTIEGTTTKVRYWYHTQFQSEGNKGIHSGLYYADTGKPYDTELRAKSSQGSVRVSYNDAEWIYYNVPLYTTVYIK